MRFRLGQAALAVLFVGLAAGGAPAANDAALAAAKPPALLSEFGFFDDLPGQKAADGVLPYDLATPLFSDGALKNRFVYVPAGKSAQYSASEAFEFPVGSALIKTFSFAADMRKPGEAIRRVETRILIRQADGWLALAYVWNDAQSDAALKIAGAKIPVSFTAADGAAVSFTYSVPNKNQCKGCHEVAGTVTPIGPKARNLNHDFAYAAGNGNQLAAWAKAGILAGAPEPEAAERAADWRDASAPVEVRARAWLDVNCAHCHRRDGPASNTGLFLTHGETDPVALGIGKRPVAAGRGSGDLAFDIVPGDPAHSILVHRAASIEPGVMMPELGRSRADPDAVALLSEWIAGLR